MKAVPRGQGPSFRQTPRTRLGNAYLLVWVFVLCSGRGGQYHPYPLTIKFSDTAARSLWREEARLANLVLFAPGGVSFAFAEAFPAW